MIDPSRIAGLEAYLKADPEVGPAVSGRVFPFKIPDSLVTQMPKACIVIRDAGGPGLIRSQGNYYSDSRVDMECYGWTDESAYGLALMVKRVLDDMPTNTSAGCRLHWARPSGGPTSTRQPSLRWPEGDADKQQHWPRAIVSFQVLADDVPQAA